MEGCLRADVPSCPLSSLPVPSRPPLQAYKPLHTFVALVGLEVWSSGDQISVTPPAGVTLDAFMKWRNDQLLKRKKHDNAHLIRWERAELKALAGPCRCCGHGAMASCNVPTAVASCCRKSPSLASS